ncbi:hypothetical protein [Brachyspira hampsonii]|nr:hypothetical protein [Brachyspira hampsonii]
MNILSSSEITAFSTLYGLSPDILETIKHSLFSDINVLSEGSI